MNIIQIEELTKAAEEYNRIVRNKLDLAIKYAESNNEVAAKNIIKSLPTTESLINNDSIWLTPKQLFERGGF